MDAKYNWIIDNQLIRGVLRGAGFAAWFWVTFALLKY
jgi:hypothetical protein